MIYKLDINDRAAPSITNKTKKIEILVDRKNKNIVTLEELIPDWWGGMTEYNEKYNFTKT